MFKIIFKMKYFYINYFFLLTASALTTVPWSLTYTTSRYRTRFSLMMEVDGTAKTSGFAAVSYTHLDVYKRQTQNTIPKITKHINTIA